MEGWIKDWRQEIESQIWQMPPLYYKVWQYLKYSANYEDIEVPAKDGSSTVIKRGQILTTLRKIAEDVGWYERGVFKKPSPSMISKILDWLKKNDMITVEVVNSSKTVITICNYDKFQSTNQEVVNSLRTDCEHTYKKEKKYNNIINNNIYTSNESSKVVSLEKKISKGESKKEKYDEEFEKIWAGYRKNAVETLPGSKKEAYKEFKKLLKKHDIETIKDHIRYYLIDCKRTGTKTKQLVNFLKKEDFDTPVEELYESARRKKQEQEIKIRVLG
ncbi:hypothetical protein [Deferribacter abyssi]|uniref:hypothetical protein n=1 Tax=Deferribacter abyssi TaxID=213806 RepID=UPI003C19B92B